MLSLFAIKENISKLLVIEVLTSSCLHCSISQLLKKDMLDTFTNPLVEAMAWNNFYASIMLREIML